MYVKSKFRIGQTVFIKRSNSIIECEVTSILVRIHEDQYSYAEYTLKYKNNGYKTELIDERLIKPDISAFIKEIADDILNKLKKDVDTLKESVLQTLDSIKL